MHLRASFFVFSLSACEASSRERIWYYEPITQSCLESVYSGCGGNANRFTSLESCERSCITGQCCLRAQNNPLVLYGHSRDGFDRWVRKHFDLMDLHVHVFLQINTQKGLVQIGAFTTWSSTCTVLQFNHWPNISKCNCFSTLSLDQENKNEKIL